MCNCFIYILTNKWHTVLYTRQTDSLENRLTQHKLGVFPGFTKRYSCDQLVYFERFDDMSMAIARENQIKGWTRAKKEALIATLNPDWDDLSRTWKDIK